LHAVHQDRADHATPADQADTISDFFHVFPFRSIIIHRTRLSMAI
jgi:hypothetical protein